jgi:pyrroloquinoline quinone (PQQ) biosynthesis protein C
MDFSAAIAASFRDAMASFDSSPAIMFLKSDKFQVRHYASVLREIYHYTKEDPQLQALAAVYLRGSDRRLVKLFLKHATSEVGHDFLALQDLKALGHEPADVQVENPLPATNALTAYPFYVISYRNPIGYLGYLYFLEHMPTEHGATYAAALRRANVPQQALGFLSEHMQVDVAHNKLMLQYVRQLVHSREDCDAVCYALTVTAELYSNMLWAAIQRTDNPRSYGISWVEKLRYRENNLSEVEG